MKNFKLLSLLGIVLVAGAFLGGCGNKANEETNNDIIIEDTTAAVDAVIDYNDSLVDLATTCIVSEDTIWDAYDNETFEVEIIQNAISDTLNECKSAISQIEAIGDWEGDSSLKDGIITLLEKDIAYYEKFYDMVPYLGNEDLTEEEANLYDTIIAEIDVIDQELEEANTNLVTIQNEFAVRHGYELEETVE